MRIGLTGHTRGYGKYMHERLLNEGHEVVTFSKSTGYDITCSSDRMTIRDMVSDCDIFINNAQDGFAQTELLYDIYYAWKDDRRLILNIGSNARDFTPNDYAGGYHVQKQALNLASKQLGRRSECRVSTVDYGYLVRDEGTQIGYDDAFYYIEVAMSAFEKDHRLLEILVAHEK